MVVLVPCQVYYVRNRVTRTNTTPQVPRGQTRHQRPTAPPTVREGCTADSRHCGGGGSKLIMGNCSRRRGLQTRTSDNTFSEEGTTYSPRLRSGRAEATEREGRTLENRVNFIDSLTAHNLSTFYNTEKRSL